MRPSMEYLPHCFNQQRQTRTRMRRRALSARALLLCAVLSVSPLCLSRVLADDGALSAGESSSAQRPSGPERNFYQVLDELLADFEFDIKNGNITSLKDLSIRNIVVSESVPPSFKNHLELLVTERILKNSKSRVIQCLPCRSKRAKLDGESMVITATDTNPVELARIAKMTGISGFMDLAFTYASSGMVLSLTLNDAEGGAVIWTRSYNSETTRAAAARRGVDYNQQEQARDQIEYAPLVQYRALVNFMFEPDTSGTATVLALGFRMMERYDNRKKEVGFEMNYMLDTGSLTGSAAATTTGATPAVKLWSGFNLTVLFMHAWNLIGSEENFHQARGSVFAGAGGSYTSGFLGGLIRGGYEWRLGKKFAVSGILGYRPPATAFTASPGTGTSVSGLEFGVGVNLLF